MFDTLLQILCAFGSALPCFRQEESNEDIIGDLPTEVTSTIFRYLDSKSLVSAAGVNRRWKSICSCDAVLRHRVRRQLRSERKARIQNYFSRSGGIQVIRTAYSIQVGGYDPFVARNGYNQVKKLPVEYEIPILKKRVRTVAKKQKVDKKESSTMNKRLRL